MSEDVIFRQGFIAYVGGVVDPPESDTEPFAIEDGPDYPLAWLLANAERREKKAREEKKWRAGRILPMCAAFVCVTPDKRRRCSQLRQRDSEFCKRHRLKFSPTVGEVSEKFGNSC